ncbi:TetR/AcrR family transcriptional regulator [Rugosimonospora africana]|uniref:TetR family transcriptional regulator n=1 Tax=Rugosimonospora africana TaxID=556532 RepID=A0A8J3QWG8_9ACTN|nr:TetR/AcrR family transcriptional regulator [Rugosimonospora africana]GIH17639.1 TetR family transcriptional regulator [Rugosimonospora africana]
MAVNPESEWRHMGKRGGTGSQGGQPPETAGPKSTTGLPPSIEAAWGLRERPTKGPRRGLTLPQIVEAGVRVAVSEGLGAVSMGRVAAELGASTMSLYRYVSAKDELIDLMMDLAIGVPPEPDPGQGWRAGLTWFAQAYRDLLLQHSWMLRVRISAPPMTPNQIAWLEYALTYLRDTALTGSEKLSTVLMLSGYVRNVTGLEADITAAALAAGSTAEAAMLSYGQLYAKVVDPARFPETGKLIADGVMDQEDLPDNEFNFGLGRILDGLGALIDARREPSSEET